MKVATVCIQFGGGAVYPATTAPTHLESRKMSDATPSGIDASALKLDTLFSASQDDATAAEPPPRLRTAAQSDPRENERLAALMARIVLSDQKALVDLYDATASHIFSVARCINHEEIASQTHLPLGTVKSNIWRALAVLRTHLAPTFPAQGALTS